MCPTHEATDANYSDARKPTAPAGPQPRAGQRRRRDDDSSRGADADAEGPVHQRRREAARRRHKADLTATRQRVFYTAVIEDEDAGQALGAEQPPGRRRWSRQEANLAHASVHHGRDSLSKDDATTSPWDMTPGARQQRQRTKTADVFGSFGIPPTPLCTGTPPGSTVGPRQGTGAWRRKKTVRFEDKIVILGAPGEEGAAQPDDADVIMG